MSIVFMIKTTQVSKEMVETPLQNVSRTWTALIWLTYAPAG